MTVRWEFDAFCFARTLEAGVSFLKVRGIKGVSIVGGDGVGDWVEVDTGEEQLRGLFVVGADGVNSQVRRLCEGAGDVKGGFALEAQVPAAGDEGGFDVRFWGGEKRIWVGVP